MNTGNPRATGEDLTAKARIRNAAMDLYAQQGEDRTSMRAIADAAYLGFVQTYAIGVARLDPDEFAQEGEGALAAALQAYRRETDEDFPQDPARQLAEVMRSMARAWDGPSARLLRQESGNVVQDAAQQAIASIRLMVQLPARLDTVVTRLEEGRLSVSVPNVERTLTRLERVARRIVSAVLFTGLLIGGVLLLPVNAPFGTALMIVSAIPLLHAALAGTLGRRGPD